MKREQNRRFGRLLEVLLCFMGLALFVLAERAGLRYQGANYQDPYLPEAESYNWKDPGDQKDCLLVYRSGALDSEKARNQLQFILKDMRVGYEEWDMETSGLPKTDPYQTVILAVSDLSPFGEHILDLCRWVDQGGRLMFALPLQKERTMDLIAAKIGIEESNYEYVEVDSVIPEADFMIGGGRPFAITDPYESSAMMRVDESCHVYVKAEDSDVPLIWSRDYGAGRFVVTNLGFMDKAYRGFYSAAYSLLEDICVYPVINGSAFYIDDFPSPVPQGDGTYIRRDYGMSISDFYSNVWWPDMLDFSKEYQLRYTGLIIENYEDQTYGELARNGDISRYQFFGNMLLSKGGELGLHGYNHQPLCTSDFVYTDDLGYKTWESLDEMQDAMEELIEFSKGVFPGEHFEVYVPPSNVLSPEGRTMLAEEFPEIRCIASIYFHGEDEYEQEFEVADDGMVETPRVISGCEIGDYMQLAALSELNLHFVNSHFMHPDDLLDPDRGAAIGWKALKGTFSNYLDWLYRSAPEIRNLTGSQMGGAVQRYCATGLWKMDTPDKLYLTVDGLYDEAYMFVRVNRGDVGAVKGGELTHLTGNLYLLHVTDSEVELERNR